MNTFLSQLKFCILPFGGQKPGWGFIGTACSFRAHL